MLNTCHVCFVFNIYTPNFLFFERFPKMEGPMLERLQGHQCDVLKVPEEGEHVVRGTKRYKVPCKLL